METRPRPRALPPLAVVLVLVTAPLSTRAQALPESLGALPEEAARGWLEPLLHGFGSAMAAGFVTSAAPRAPLAFSLALRTTGTPFQGRDERFVAVAPGRLAYRGETFSDPWEPVDGTLSTPTVAGRGSGIVLGPRPGSDFEAALVRSGRDPASVRIVFPRGLDLPAAPFASLEATLGLGFGTAVKVRSVPTVALHDDLGDMSALGASLVHSLSPWLPALLPGVHLAVFGAVQRLRAGDWLEASARSAGMAASTAAGIVGLYGYAALHGGEADVEYRVRNPGDQPALPAPGTRVRFSRELSDGVQAGAGLSLQLGGVHVTAEYTFADPPAVSASLGLGPR